MSGQTVILREPIHRQRAVSLIWAAPKGAVVNVREMKRTTEQNAKMWAMLSDISRAKPDGRMHTTEVWKAMAMHALKWEVQFLEGIDGKLFPNGYRSSHLTKAQMSELIEFLYAYGAEKGVEWSEPYLEGVE